MTQSGALVVVGDALLDRDVRGTAERLCPDAPVPVLDEAESCSRPGGAALAAALAAADSRDVTLITALAADAAAEELRAGLERAGVELVDLGLQGPTPEKIRFIAGERPVLRVDRGPHPVPVGPATATARAVIGWADAVLVSDYGRGLAAEPGLREAIGGLQGRVPVVWDPHPRGPVPLPGMAVLTPNEAEAARVAAGCAGPGTQTVAIRAQALRRVWRANAVCVTRGPRGALLACGPAPPLALAAASVAGGDPCGAGDRFASWIAGALADGRPLADAARAAVAAASAFVAAGGARRALDRGHGDVRRPATDTLELAERVRASGGTIVATGGCFDILHAGHVQTLEAARRLGDCLVVLLNSDASVRSLKGPGRPLVSEAARASVLGALACVDAVMVFDAATPEAALARLRPHVWAKGGDYRGAELPESACLAEWGGRAVILPYLDGHSTTRLIAEAAARG
jgi:rfaE bifunctional protein nucleotidyltransferase chain/domain/rfaE bifunctional protein kinase chain/domain